MDVGINFEIGEVDCCYNYDLDFEGGFVLLGSGVVVFENVFGFVGDCVFLNFFGLIIDVVVFYVLYND